MADPRKARLLKSPLLWTTFALLGGMLLHIDRVPFWVSACAFVCVAWRLAAEARAIRLPGKWARAGVAMLLIAAILARFQTINGLSAGTALLVVMGAIKLLETHSRRDKYVVLGATAFLLLAACLDRQALTRAPLYLLEAWLCCTALATVAHEGSSLSAGIAARLAARSLGLAVPLALVLFLFFPRMVGAFWTLPQSGSAITGLGETMTPGAISELSESDEPAFRVRFEGAPPPPEERYWRGPVMHEFDGYTWSRGQRFYLQPTLQPQSPAYTYNVTMEPTSQRWWFALDTVSDYPRRRAFLTFDHQLMGTDVVSRPITYKAVSYTRTVSTEPGALTMRRYDTRLPAGRNMRSVQLARQMYADSRSEAEFVQSVLAMFARQGFEYTLTPPLLSLDSVDDFLFKTKQGFCGHYASAFVTMMRAAGVPARVVTGYLGGEWNPIREYFVIRQSDAHAWAEVWLEGRGWTRVDPTAVVAPERLRRGVYDVIPNSLSGAQRALREFPFLTDMRQRWDAMNDWWNERVVRFDFNTQVDLLRLLGFNEPDWAKLGWLFAVGLTSWLLFVAWHTGKALRRTPMDRLARAYTRLCAKLARAGVPREPHEGPLAYADTVATRHPNLASTARALLRRYADLRYGRKSANPADIAAFERHVARFSVSSSMR